MKHLLNIGLAFIVSLIFPFIASSHESDTVHEEVPATVDPMVAIGVVVFIVIGGIIIWRVMFSKKKAPTVQSSNVQAETPKVDSQPSQPENIEAKK
ncbi:MAG: hypothetical protein A3E40_04300 [Candidatus Levybacteria bacterium RIFCSPHIGHO2_12_FULL_37_9]|nr:MAG: hypothetical protein A3E40_04300 [Candidatus Levybacteria bacterium RIFCSPHIGHO2_12_FULL_37_9]